MKNKRIKFAKFRFYMNEAIDYFTKNEYISVIICAAGLGTRMGGVSKQLISLNGIPCIAHSLIAFQKSKVDEIIVASKPEEMNDIKEICKNYEIKKVSSIVPGGKTRQESISNAFNAVSKNSRFVMIHDAARPCISLNDIDVLIKDAKKYGAATASVPCTDSLKLEEDGFINKSLDRNSVRLVQTPQIFKTDMYRIALNHALKNNLSVTDDNALVESVGFKVKLSNTSKLNMKLTVPEDKDIIEYILKKGSQK